MNRKSFCFYVLAITITMIISLMASGCIVEPTPDPPIAGDIAARFGVDPTWDSIRVHLALDVFCQGMSREEAHRVLDKVGPWEVTTDDWPDDGVWDSDTGQMVFRENIRFLDKETWIGLGDWAFLYDENNKIVRQGSIDDY